jgi:hypothetical protein
MARPMTIFLSETKISPALKKIQNYRNKRVQIIRRMDRDRHTDFHAYLCNVGHVGDETKDDPSEDPWIVNGNGTGHEA